MKFWLTLSTIIGLAGLVSLGIWQLHRYEFKKQLVTQYQTAQRNKPIPLEKLKLRKDISFQHVSVSGRYLNARTLLLQNRFYKDRLGFDVLTPLKVTGTNQVLLINRGWIPAQNQHQTPAIRPIKTTQHITGYVQLVNSYVFTLGKNILEPIKWPLKIQKIDIPQFALITKLRFYPFVLHLDPHQPNGFVREWKPVSVTPERHLGYAVQWLALALVLLVGYVFLSIKHRERKKP